MDGIRSIQAGPLLGFGLGPVLATQTEAMTGSWRYVFYFAAVPGLVVAALLFFLFEGTGSTCFARAPATGLSGLPLSGPLNTMDVAFPDRPRARP